MHVDKLWPWNEKGASDPLRKVGDTPFDSKRTIYMFILKNIVKYIKFTPDTTVYMIVYLIIYTSYSVLFLAVYFNTSKGLIRTN